MATGRHSSIDLSGVERRLRAAADRAALTGAELLYDASTRVAPTDPGDELVRSAKVTTARDADGAVAAVSYDTDYAVLQHEALDFHHDAGRQAKYLEGPMHEQASAIRDAIADELRKALR